MASAIIAIAVILFCFRILFGKPVTEWLDRVEGRGGEPRRLHNVRHQLWHPESPGVKVTVAPGLPRRLGLVREPFATSREMKSVYEMNAQRGDPRRAAQERVLSADEVRELEWKMGVGPFAGKEDWCDPREQCHHRDHGPIDEETGLWKVELRPAHILLPEGPIVAREYREGDTQVTYHDSSSAADRTVKIDDLTVDQATKLVAMGVLAPEVLLGAIGWPRTHATGVAPKRPANPNLVKWKDWRAIFRADQLAQEGRPLAGYCTSSLHEHVNIASRDGVVRRRCENY